MRALRIVEIVGNAYAGGWMDPFFAGFKARSHKMALVLPREGPLTHRAQAMGVYVHFHPLPKHRQSVRKTAPYTRDVVHWWRGIEALEGFFQSQLRHGERQP